jgi:hypothetical protein
MNRKKTLITALIAFFLSNSGFTKANNAYANSGHTKAEQSFRQEIQKIGGKFVGNHIIIERTQDPVPTYPKADPNVPIKDYIPWDSEQPTIYMYYALNKKPVDYDGILSRLSAPYRNLSNEFEKRDVINQLKEKLDENITYSRNHRHFFFYRKLYVEKYDFNKKRFDITGDFFFQTLSSGPYTIEETLNHPIYLNPAPFRTGIYGIKLTNYDDYKYIDVPDEAIARKIENLRTSNKYLIQFHCFARGADDSSSLLYAQIVQISIIDYDGNVYASK